jgi:hypothetical protein
MEVTQPLVRFLGRSLPSSSSALNKVVSLAVYAAWLKLWRKERMRSGTMPWKMLISYTK